MKVVPEKLLRNILNPKSPGENFGELTPEVLGFFNFFKSFRKSKKNGSPIVLKENQEG